MKITSGLLRNAVDFVAQAKTDSVKSSKYVEISIHNGTISVKLASDIIISISATYTDPIISTDITAKFVVNVDKIKNFLKNNKSDFNIEIQENSALLSGRGTLKLAYIHPNEYEICQYDSEKFDIDSYTKSATVDNIINGNDTINGIFANIKKMLQWADSTTPIPLFKNTYFQNEYGSARQQKSNISVLFKNCFHKSFSVNALIDTSILGVLCKLNNIDELIVKSDMDSTRTFSFLAYNHDINIMYKCVSRLMEGQHQLIEISNMVETIRNKQQLITVKTKELITLLERTNGYFISSKEDGSPIASIACDSNILEIGITQEGDSYKDSIECTCPNKLTFNINLENFIKIANSYNGDTMNIYCNSVGTSVKSFCITSNINDTSNYTFLFPANN